jgi:prolipoprotein diacylglyceryltransferase
MNKLIQKGQRRQGYYFGLVLALIFCIRFLIEFLKEIQSPFEAGLLLDMGQLLSIPFIVAGLAIVVIKRKPEGSKTRKGSNKSSNSC